MFYFAFIVIILTSILIEIFSEYIVILKFSLNLIFTIIML